MQVTIINTTQVLFWFEYKAVEVADLELLRNERTRYKMLGLMIRWSTHMKFDLSKELLEIKQLLP